MVYFGIAIGIGIEKNGRFIARREKANPFHDSRDKMHRRCALDFDPDPDSDSDSEHGNDITGFTLNCSCTNSNARGVVPRSGGRLVESPLSDLSVTRFVIIVSMPSTLIVAGRLSQLH
jgi:hypothetical protein